MTTFSFYRLAKYRGVVEACATTQGRVDGQLLLGAALFGTGWGATGACPGPLVVIVGAAPTAMGPLLILLGVAAGVLLTNSVSTGGWKLPSSQASKRPFCAILPDGPPPAPRVEGGRAMLVPCSAMLVPCTRAAHRTD